MKTTISIFRKEDSIALFLKFFRYFKKRFSGFFFCLTSPYYWLKIKTSNFKNIDELVDLTFNGFGKLIKPNQIPEEICQLLKILEKKKPRIILEIGTEKGGTLFLFSNITPKNAVIVSIDLPQGKFGGGYPKWKIPLYKSFVKENRRIFLIRVDSHERKSLEKVKEILNNQKIDFLFIDGDHTYEGVKKDWEIYKPLVKKGGLIAFHDIVVHPSKTGCEVNKFWEEIKERYDYVEIVKDLNQSWAGIGVIYI